MRGNAILFSEMTPDTSFEENFNDWYDHEHIPIRMKAPGFVSAQRYVNKERRGYLAVYELDGLTALKTPTYEQIKGQPSDRTRWMLQNVSGFTRYLCRSIGVAENAAGSAAFDDAVILYAVWFNVPQSDVAEFDDWYDKEHVPMLMKCPDWLQVRRFEVVDGEPQTYSRLALHYLASEAALDSPERAAARTTSWRETLARRPWFKGQYSIFSKRQERQIGLGGEI
jgi:hypothetical protein